jgi:hypothetical protein
MRFNSNTKWVTLEGEDRLNNYLGPTIHNHTHLHAYNYHTRDGLASQGYYSLTASLFVCFKTKATPRFAFARYAQ